MRSAGRRTTNIIKEALPLLPWFGIGLLAAGALKMFHARAGADGLNWLLEPTARLAEVLSGIGFEREMRTGWVSHSHRMIVGPGCAGLNFLVIAFSAFFFTLVHRFRRAAARGLWMGTSLCLAYLLTIGANALRILFAICLFDANLYAGAVTPARVHRLEGILVYSLSLLLAYLAIERAGWTRGAGRGSPLSSPLVPLGWYLAITVGIPLLTRAYRPDPAAFLEHAGTVAAVVLAMGLIVYARIRFKTRPAATVGPP